MRTREELLNVGNCDFDTGLARTMSRILEVLLDIREQNAALHAPEVKEND